MLYNAQNAYLESRLLSADRLELVRMLYQTAIEAIRDARKHLANKDILQRARAISKAGGILLELTASLDFERGGEIAPNLAALYRYMMNRLTEAHVQQNDEHLAEVLGLLSTLLEAWDAISTPAAPVQESKSAWAPPLSLETVPAGAVHAWSF